VTSPIPRLLTSAKGLLVRCNALSGLGRTLGEEIATDEREVGEKLAGLGVGEDESEEGAKVANGCERG
jgi:hypothetical protein